MNTAKTNIIEVLQLISSKSLQVDFYDENEEPLDMPERFFRMWETAYIPNMKKFQDAFSDKEKAQLARFNDFFLQRLSVSPSDIRELMKDPYWNSVCEFASQLLEDFVQYTGQANR